MTTALNVSKELTAAQQEFAKVVPYQTVEKFFALTKKLTIWEFAFDAAMCGMQFTVGIDPRAAWVIAHWTGEKVSNWANEAQPRAQPIHAEDFIWQHWASYCLKEHGVTSFSTVTPENYLELFTEEIRLACFKDFTRYQFPNYCAFLKTLPGHESFMLGLSRKGMNEVHEELHLRYPSDKELNRIWNSVNAEVRAVQARDALQCKLHFEESERQIVVQKTLQSSHMHKELAVQHTAIADAMTKIADVPEYAIKRHEAVGNFLQGKDMQEIEKSYELSSDTKNLLQHNNVPLQFFTQFKGFEVQHVLHAECITMLEEMKDIEDKELKDVAMESLIVTAEANRLGHLPTACQIADFCHMLIYRAKTGAHVTADFTIGAAQGAWHGVCNLVYIISHPIETVKAIKNGIIEIGRERVAMNMHMNKLLVDLHKIKMEAARGNHENVEKLTQEFYREASENSWLISESLQRKVDAFQKASAKEKGEFFGRFALDIYLNGRLFNLTSKVAKFATSKITKTAGHTPGLKLTQKTEGAVVGAIEKSAPLEMVYDSKTNSWSAPNEIATAGGAVAGTAKKLVTVPEYNWPIPQELANTIAKSAPHFEVVMSDIALCSKELAITRYGFAAAANKVIEINYKHLVTMEFNVPRKGNPKIQGFHHDMNGTMERSGLVKYVNKVEDEFGCYRADLECGGLVKPKNTFFPQSWSRKQVIEKLYEAYDDFIKSGMKNWKELPGGKYEFYGYTSEGIKIEFYMTQTGKITTCYPVLNKEKLI